MTDQEALDFLTTKFGKRAQAAEAMGVTAQRFLNWYERGISSAMRPKVWAMVNDHGGNLPRDWLMPTTQTEAA